jgi:hypothetical protein
MKAIEQSSGVRIKKRYYRVGTLCESWLINVEFYEGSVIC